MLALLFPLASSLAVTFVPGWLLVFNGVFQGISLIGARSVPHFWVQLLSVILGVVVGLPLINRPGEGLLTITLLLIVFFMMEGFAKIIFALTIRPFPNWGWVLASGVIGVLLSGFLWSSMPVTATWLLGFLLGINLISQGAASPCTKTERASPLRLI